MSTGPLLDVCDLTVRFRPPGRATWVTPVDGVSLGIAPGRTLGLVGESGCGKTTLARAILRLIPAAAGCVRLDGRDVLAANRGQLREIRRLVQVVFQDPYASLNPRHRIGDIVGEGLAVHRIGTGDERRERIAAMLTRVGLSPEQASRFPHELSGGQRQRVAIARALILRPRLVICDEPVSALDVSIQAQILNLLSDLQAEFNTAYLFIGHNLGTVRQVSHEIAVMYLGRIVESGPAADVLENPRHPYTMALVSAVLEPGPSAALPSLLPGEPPSLSRPPTGCAFAPRCPFAVEACRREMPVLNTLDSTADRAVACLRAAELGPNSLKVALARP